MQVDHINGNRLDNRASNLRVCTHSQNQRNQTDRRTYTSSIYKGVSWHKGTQKWASNINVDGKMEYLGIFEDERDAAIAYNNAATLHFKEFASLNEVSYEG